MTLLGMKTVVQGFFISLLNTHLPNRTKRLVFLASLTARLEETESFNSETISKLNRAMELAKSDSAIKLPYELSKAIWHGKTSYQIFNEDVAASKLNVDRRRELSHRVISTMPSWLRYGTDVDIEQDVVRLLDHKSLAF